ncbi:F-box/kelch-repeat protein At1g26930-like [Ipomoea triloba]|uniref:F-box/kelch-repeat protein At1g26930-like n=1 Tax=Ipomoea triloba TaxID=35885 RepID=UPI00125E274B|nr:F-box/kelch-repeat protein At1g26930-like [Ipomoea triloba]
MLEDRSCFVSRDYHRERSWACMSFRLDANGKRPAEDDQEDGRVRKFPKQSDTRGRVDTSLTLGGNSSASEADQAGCDYEADDGMQMTVAQGGGDQHSDGVNSETGAQGGDMVADQAGDQHCDGVNSDTSCLIPGIGRDNSISCLIRCSRSAYGMAASVNRSFRSLIRSGELYKLRRMNGIIEHWVYFSCNMLEWEAFDPNLRRWMRLPTMNSNECFVFSDNESLAVGTELLVFGKEYMAQVIYRYSLLTNSWSTGMQMNEPRCLFGSACQGEIAIVAGGCDLQGKILSSAELYNSETGEWKLLPSLNKARKMCSGVFMDGKFYVIGGIGGPETKLLTSGEEYNLETETWTEIPNMCLPRTGETRENALPTTSEAPPLIAVVNDQFYAADYAEMVVRKYDKDNRVWFTIGRLPERANSMNGWGLAFRACGDKLIVIGGPRASGPGFIEVNSRVSSEGPPEWHLLGRKQSGSFVYNCAVMGC